MRQCSRLLFAVWRRKFASQSRKSLREIYLDNVHAGKYLLDKNQLKTLSLFQRISDLLEEQHSYSNRDLTLVEEHMKEKEISQQLDKVTTTNNNGSIESVDSQPSSSAVAQSRRLRGAYVYGNVGTGKTMCMDLFFNQCNLQNKRRVHFHKFMNEIHKRIFDFKQKLLDTHGKDRHINLSSERDAITHVAQEIAMESRLLCFDEFQVTDICDALILSKLFGELWRNDVVLIATSNRPPQDLYRGGLNRHYFLPFIDALQRECIVRHITTDWDYRIENSLLSEVSITPISPDSRSKLLMKYHDVLSDLQRATSSSSSFSAPHTISNDSNHLPFSIPVGFNRSFPIKIGNLSRKIAWLEFSQICEEDRSAVDFQALCHHFSILFVSDIPRMSIVSPDIARRFITFIDEVYDAGIRLFWSAEVPPQQLFLDVSSVSFDANVDCALNQGMKQSCSMDSLDSSNPQQEDKMEPCWRDLPATSSSSLLSSSPSSIIEDAPIASISFREAEKHLRGENTRDKSIQGTVRVDSFREEDICILQGELSSIQELHFAFQRAASRMHEMSNRQYYQRWRERYGINTEKQLE